MRHGQILLLSNGQLSNGRLSNGLPSDVGARETQRMSLAAPGCRCKEGERSPGTPGTKPLQWV